MALTIARKNGQTYKWKHVRICNEMPHVPLRQHAWFLWRQSDGEWQYIGNYRTKREMLKEMQP